MPILAVGWVNFKGVALAKPIKNIKSSSSVTTVYHFIAGVSIGAVFVMVFILLGFDFISAFLVVVTISMITLDMFGVMYLWSIPLNAVSLVNLVMVRLHFPLSLNLCYLF